MGVAEEGAAGAGEGHHGQRHGDGHVHPDLAHVDLLRELARRGAVRGEDGGAVTVRVAGYQLEYL